MYPNNDLDSVLFIVKPPTKTTGLIWNEIKNEFKIKILKTTQE